MSNHSLRLAEDLLARIPALIVKGFDRICRETDQKIATHSIYDLAYTCKREDMVFTGTRRDNVVIWQYDIPAIRMGGCHNCLDSIGVKPWLACPIQTEQRAYPAYVFADMAGPRCAGTLGKESPLLGRNDLERLSQGMMNFHRSNYTVRASSTEEITLVTGPATLVHELELTQKGRTPTQDLYTGICPPQDVVYEATYQVFPGGRREAAVRKIRFEFRATLNHQQFNPHHALSRAGPAPQILLNGGSNFGFIGSS